MRHSKFLVVRVVVGMQLVRRVDVIMRLQAVAVRVVVVVRMVLAPLVRMPVLVDVLVRVLVHVLVAMDQRAMAVHMLVPVDVLVRVNVPVFGTGHVRLRGLSPRRYLHRRHC